MRPVRCFSQRSLGYAVVTNSPRISVVCKQLVYVPLPYLAGPTPRLCSVCLLHSGSWAEGVAPVQGLCFLGQNNVTALEALFGRGKHH